jgi:glycerol uptake facilitator-like aquaporin
VTPVISRRLAAEALGTALLLAVVVGSGIMAERLAAGNAAVALLANAVATGAALYVLITVFAPISGAHFNPAVSLAFALRGELAWRVFGGFVLVQTLAAIAGVWLAHAMFELSILQTSTKQRAGLAQALSEVVATFGLVLTILGCLRARPAAVAPAVACYIVAAYWFTASTSFANPAVTLARSLSDTFAGVRPVDILPFVAAQVVGATSASAAARWMLPERP